MHHFVDDYSRYTKVYLLRSKNEAEEMFLKYKAEMKNQLDLKIKGLRTDRDGEYESNTLTASCKKVGIIKEVSAPRSPQQNGITEYKNITLKEIMNMLLSRGVHGSGTRTK